MDFERALLATIGAAALVAVVCLVSLWLDRRRRRSVFSSPAFREAHVQPTQKAAPTVATVIELKTDGADHSASHRRQADFQRSIAPRVSENPTREWERRTNYGMY